MGLLDSILGSVMGGGKSQGSGNPLMDLALQMITSKMGGGAQAGAAGAGMGGLGGLLEQLTKGGLAEQAASWVSTGENMPVSGDQISQALGQGQIAEMASKLGMSHEQVSGGLAQILPDVINKVTPNGQVPSEDMLQNMLSMFLKK